MLAASMWMTSLIGVYALLGFFTDSLGLRYGACLSICPIATRIFCTLDNRSPFGFTIIVCYDRLSPLIPVV